MRLGILNAITPAEEVESQAAEREHFQAFFTQAPHELEFIEYRITEGEFPATPDACDAYLLTGSPQGVYDNAPWIPQLAEFIRACYAAQQKMVGICFGHQMLAHTLGGHAEKAEQGWGMGLRRFDIVTQQPWMDPPLAQGQLYFCHQDQVVKLPPAAEQLAGDAFCPNTMFAIGDRVLGIQGHPEFSEAFMQYLIHHLQPNVGDTVAGKAAASLRNGQADNAVIARWVVNFLKQ